MFKQLSTTISILLFSMLLMAQKTIYVTSIGNNVNNSLSESTPMESFSHLNTMSLSAGEKVLFKKGDIFTGQKEVKSSGTSAITIRYLSQNIFKNIFSIGILSSGISTNKTVVLPTTYYFVI